MFLRANIKLKITFGVACKAANQLHLQIVKIVRFQANYKMKKFPYYCWFGFRFLNISSFLSISTKNHLNLKKYEQKDENKVQNELIK